MNLAREIFICASILKVSNYLFFVVLFTTFLSAAYNLYLYSCQQGVPSFVVGYSQSISSSFMLTCFMHIIPIYIGMLSIFYFCVWRNSLIKVFNCGLKDRCLPFLQWSVDILFHFLSWLVSFCCLFFLLCCFPFYICLLGKVVLYWNGSYCLLVVLLFSFLYC